MPYADELVGIGVGKRFEKDALENAEDNGVAADASGESDEGDESEERRVREAAKHLLEMDD